MKILKLLENYLSKDDLEFFANHVKEKLGLQEFNLYLTNSGDIQLSDLIVPKNLRKTGLGSKALEMLNDFADKYNKRVILTTGTKDDVHGTTSKNRLIKFYKKSGYLLNKGRNKDFTISDNMYRNRKLNELYEPTNDG